MVRSLLGQSVVAQRGPMANGRRLDECHRDLEFMEGQAARYCSRKCIGAPSQANDPAGLGQVMQGLADVSRRDPEVGGETHRAFNRKNPLSGFGEHAGEFRPRRATD